MSSNSLPEAYNSLLDQNIRSGSLVAYWCLKARLIRLCAIAFHKWVRYSDEMKRVLTNSPSDNVNRNSIGYISTVSSIDRNDPTSTTIPNNTKQFQNSGDDEDDVMSEEMENLRMASRGNRSRRGGVAVPLSIPSPKSLGNTQNDIDSAPEVLKVGTDTIEGSDAVQAATNTGSLLNSTIYKTASMKRMEEEKKVDEFASAMHDAIIDGKRNLLRKFF